MNRTPLLILGGGPAGAAAAIRLQRAGLAPLLVERTAEPADALCGGFLSWATVKALAALGVDAESLGHAVTRLRLIAGDRIAEADLPARAIGLSRLTLDAALIARVGRVERGVAARHAAPGRVATGDGAEIAFDALFLATGKHDVRGLARPKPEGDPAIGLRLRLKPIARLSGAIELHLFDRGYAGLVTQEDGAANLCMAVRRSRLAGAGGDPARLVEMLGRENPRLGDRLAAGALGPVQAVANIPYGWRAAEPVPGLYRLGDQAAVIPSLAGEGIGIALASAAAAVRCHLAGEPAFQPRFAACAARPLRLAGLARAVAERPGLARPLLPLMPALAGTLARLTRIAAD